MTGCSHPSVNKSRLSVWLDGVMSGVEEWGQDRNAGRMKEYLVFSAHAWYILRCVIRSVMFTFCYCIMSHPAWDKTFKNIIRQIILIIGSLILILDSYRAARHNWQNSKVCRFSENCDSGPLSSVYFLHSLKTVYVGSSSPFSSRMPSHSAALTQNRHS